MRFQESLESGKWNKEELWGKVSNYFLNWSLEDPVLGFMDLGVLKILGIWKNMTSLDEEIRRAKKEAGKRPWGVV